MKADTQRHVEKVRNQFRKQADAYSQMAIVTNKGLIDALVAIGGASASDRALDVASGPGFLTMALAQKCAQVTGIDATDAFVSRARAEAARRGLKNINFELGDVQQMPFRDASFDLATCRFAFHHFAEPRAVLGEIARVLKPGGRVVIADMLASEDPVKAEYHNRIERLCDPSHARALPASEFEGAFAAAGIEIVQRRERETSYRVSDWIAHGGPPQEDIRRIEELMRASLEQDKCGLRVRIEDGELHFSHTGVTYRLRKPL